LTGLFPALARMRRAIGALVLLCAGMITAAPVVAITLGDECEKQCCLRKASAHACCKRGKAGTTAGFAAAQARCCPGNANVGLARFDVGTAAAPAILTAVTFAEMGAAHGTGLLRGEAVLPEHALFGRPPPVH
jgi:hypothetical protein